MVDEVESELFDIEVMIFFLKVIVGDFVEVFLSNSCLLFGCVEMKGIGIKIKMIIF